MLPLPMMPRHGRLFHDGPVGSPISCWYCRTRRTSSSTSSVCSGYSRSRSSTCSGCCWVAQELLRLELLLLPHPFHVRSQCRRKRRRESSRRMVQLRRPLLQLPRRWDQHSAAVSLGLGQIDRGVGTRGGQLRGGGHGESGYRKKMLTTTISTMGYLLFCLLGY